MALYTKILGDPLNNLKLQKATLISVCVFLIEYLYLNYEQGHLLSPLQFKNTLNTIANTIKQVKKKEVYSLRKE